MPPGPRKPPPMAEAWCFARSSQVQFSRPPRTCAAAPFRPGTGSRGKPRERTESEDMRPYELMYLMPPTSDEERLSAVSERLQCAITALGGKIAKATRH